MSARSFFRGFFWSVVALFMVVHVVGGWLYSSELIDSSFTPLSSTATATNIHADAIEVSYQTSLGQMDALHLPTSGATWVIHVHGTESGPDQMDYLFDPIRDAGFSQLSIYHRNDFGQPSDPSGYYRYGATEWEDIAGAVEFAELNGAEAIILSGFGTGASHILSFAYRNNLDELKGLVFDASNIDMGDTVDYGFSQRDLPILPMKVPPTLSWVAKFFTSLRIDVNWKSIDYVSKAETSLRVPALVQQTTGDKNVPISQNISFAESQPTLVRLVQYPGVATHGSYETDPEKYVAEILSFLQENG
jgi:pimeloyl-ACP methyl ester carboxylesterase